MNNPQQSGLFVDQRLWETAENLISPDPYLRENALDQLKEIDGLDRSPLIAYLLISRISEPELEIRFHLIQLLGSLVDYDSPGQHLSDQSLGIAKDALDQINKFQLIRLLEVSDSYLAGENAIKSILKLSSYAGGVLSGIVNDWKLPISIRQQAVFYCGECGYLSSKPTLQNLIQRVEKTRNRPGGGSERKKNREDEFLYPYAVSALGKLGT